VASFDALMLRFGQLFGHKHLSRKDFIEDEFDYKVGRGAEMRE
jgi:hypothetical protein